MVDVQVHLSANEYYSHIRDNSIISDSTYAIIDDYCKAETTIVENCDQEDTISNDMIKSSVADVQVHLSANECYDHIRSSSIINDSKYVIDYLLVDRMQLPDCSSSYLTVLPSSVAKPEEVDRMNLPDCYPESPDYLTVLPSSQAKLEEQHVDDHYMPLSELTLTSETCYASIITVDTCARVE